MADFNQAQVEDEVVVEDEAVVGDVVEVVDAKIVDEIELEDAVEVGVGGNLKVVNPSNRLASVDVCSAISSRLALHLFLGIDFRLLLRLLLRVTTF